MTGSIEYDNSIRDDDPNDDVQDTVGMKTVLVVVHLSLSDKLGAVASCRKSIKVIEIPRKGDNVITDHPSEHDGIEVDQVYITENSATVECHCRDVLIHLGALPDAKEYWIALDFTFSD